MTLRWIHENPPRWDDDKARIVGGAAPGTFDLSRYEGRDVLPGEWWRVEKDGYTAGYGWMDYSWGEGEMLLAVARECRDSGIGTFILDRLEDEARERKLRYLYNVVRDSHPDPEGVARWLEARRFRPDRGRLVRRVESSARPGPGAEPLR
jgi:N-acetylglutamate synthase-like GNAT family acetyltransferase